ncbi:hypothetical protein FSHL1_012761 [Fusarium sambucinum]
MVQLNTIVGSIGLFVLGVSAGPCRPTDMTTTVVTTEPTTATTDLATATATATTAPVATTSTVPEGEPECSIESPQYGGSGGEYEVYCDSFAGNAWIIATRQLDVWASIISRPMYLIVVSGLPLEHSVNRKKGVILAKRVVATTVEPTAP